MCLGDDSDAPLVGCGNIIGSVLLSRRTALTLLPAAAAARPQAPDNYVGGLVIENDKAVESYIERQNVDPASRWRGAVPDQFGLHEPGSASGLLLRGVASYVRSESRFHGGAELRTRIKLAAEHLERVQTPDGNVDLLVTNFNSPPDTGFVMLNVGVAASLARKHGEDEIFGWMEPFVRRAGEGLVKGGIHTPNHRWVVCAALALTHRLFPDPAYVRRIDQWLAEGIDIGPDGQYSERSTTVYNAITNNALIMVADLLDRPGLLGPVRQNLEAMLYLLHPNYEVVTEISRRQDRNTTGDMGRYWFGLRYLARKDGNGGYETLTRAFEPSHASLGQYLDFPTLQANGPAPKPVPSSYERLLPASNLVRIRRGKTSATLVLEGSSRFFALRRGDAVINGVRFAAAFFGKGQFTPTRGEKRDGAYRMEQTLEGPYFQPHDPPRKQPWGGDEWHELRAGREQTEVSRIRYIAEVRERTNGFDLRIKTEGTANVPLAVEINLRDGGEIEGVTQTSSGDQAYLLSQGYALYRLGGDSIRFGPGLAETEYTQVRGAEPKLQGPSVYLTTFTPVDRVIEFRWG